MQALVPIMPYADKGSLSSSALLENQEYDKIPLMHPPQLDVKTLLYVAQNNMRPQRSNPVDKKGFFKCGAKDHWHRECPCDEKQPHLRPAQRFCSHSSLLLPLTHSPIPFLREEKETK